jgi:hypothetical protein
VSGPNGQGATVEVQDIIAALQSLHAQQLSAANMEAARWQAIAAAAQRRVAALEAADPLSPNDMSTAE